MSPPIVFTAHALERAYQRLGFHVAQQEQYRVFLAIVEGTGAILLRRHDDGMEVYAVHIYGVASRVVYRPSTGCVITVLEGLSGRSAAC